MTTVSAPEPVRFDAILSRAWALFKPNWTIALPLVIALVVVVIGCVALGIAGVLAAAGAIAGGASHRAQVAQGALGVLILALFVFFVVAVLVVMWAVTAVYGMADAVWTRGSATLADGNAAFVSRFGAVLVAGIGMFGLGILAVILMLPTLGIALLAYPLFTMYVFPAVVAGRRSGFDAIGESFALVRNNFGPSALTLLILYAIGYGISLIGSVGILPAEFASMGGHRDVPVMPPIPLLVGSGIFYFASLVVTVIYAGFQALALVGLYHDVSARSQYPQLAPGPPPAPVVPG